MSKDKPLYRDPKQPIAKRVEDLLGRMTLEEKAWQLIQRTVSLDVNPNNIGKNQKFEPMVGSILSYLGGVAKRNAFQKLAVENTRLGIPIIWGMDVIHGLQTVFPIPLAQACSFDPASTEAGCRFASMESYYAKGFNWTFSPMVDVPHDPRWGRVAEGYGEDPYTSGVFGAAAVRGYQGKDLSQPGAMAACLKHFVGYAASEGGRDYSYTDISRRALHEWYLPSFKAAVEAGARTLMSSFNDITGTPAAANRYTMTEILRERWGFTGFIVSDWGGVNQLGNQGLTQDDDEKCRLSLSAGNDMDMVDDIFLRIPKLVESGRLDIAVVDEAVRRVLRVKFELGLFEHPYVPEKIPAAASYGPAAEKIALDAARGCIVLLKNKNDILPLPPAQPRKNGKRPVIALIGPAADDPEALIGCWSFATDRTKAGIRTLKETIAAHFPGYEIRYAKGCDIWNEHDTSGFAQAMEVASRADIIIAALGESSWRSGENASHVKLTLPAAQQPLLENLATLCKPIIALLVSGRPMVYTQAEPYCDAMLQLWHGGTKAADACWDVVTGAYNPSGRLAITFPRDERQIPIYYNMHRRARPDQGNYHDLAESPLYEFGYGLSYTEFEYSNLKVAKSGKGFTAEVTVTNTGKRAGKETVFWYIGDPEASITQPIRRLIAFTQVELKPGKSQTVKLAIDPMRDLSYPDDDGQRILEPGRFILEASRKLTTEFVLE